MNEIILLVEDKSEEQEKAKRVLISNGFKPAVAGTLIDALRIWENLKDKIKGIITDIHFPERSAGHHPKQMDAAKPSGIAIIAKAVTNGLPIVVCSDIDHHFADYLKIVMEKLSTLHPLKKIPFIMNSKDWELASKELKKLIERKEEKL